MCLLHLNPVSAVVYAASDLQSVDLNDFPSVTYLVNGQAGILNLSCWFIESMTVFSLHWVPSNGVFSAYIMGVLMPVLGLLLQ